MNKRLLCLAFANTNQLVDPDKPYSEGTHLRTMEHFTLINPSTLHSLISKGESQPLKGTRKSRQSDEVGVNSAATSSLYLSANISRKSKLSTNRKPSIGSSYNQDKRFPTQTMHDNNFKGKKGVYAISCNKVKKQFSSHLT